MNLAINQRRSKELKEILIGKTFKSTVGHFYGFIPVIMEHLIKKKPVV
jgi:hypothetical protein